MLLPARRRPATDCVQPAALQMRTVMARSAMPIDARRPSKVATQDDNVEDEDEEDGGVGVEGASRQATNNAEHNPHANHILAYLTILTPCRK